MDSLRSKTPRPDYITFIGPLQLAVLGQLWSVAPRSLPLYRLHQRVNKAYKPLALTTICTALNRLILVSWAEKTGRAAYRAGITREELIEIVSKPIREA